MAEFLVLSIYGPVLALPFLALLAGITLVAPSWRWVAGFIVIVWAALAYGWMRHWIESGRSGYNEGLAGALGIGFFTLVTVSVVFGSALYAAAMLWMSARQRGQQRIGSD